MWMRAIGTFLLLAAFGQAQDTPLPSPPPLPPPPRGDFPPGFQRPGHAMAQQYKELVPALIESMKDSDADVRQHAAIALATIGRDALKPVLEALKSANKEQRSAAAYALGQMGELGQEGIPELTKALKDEEVVVRRAAALALSRIVASDSYFSVMPMRPGAAGPRFVPAPGGVEPSALPFGEPRRTPPEKK